MKSPPPETGPPNPETGPPNPKKEEPEESEAGTKPSEKSQEPRESEKDSGYSDSSSESLGSEEPNGSAPVTGPGTQGTSTVQTTYTSIYILQNVVLKQPRLLLLQSPGRRHRKRPAPSSYLPILRSYPRIAPRLAPLPSPSTSPPPITRPSASHLLQVSLRSLALLRRTRETQRSVRELRGHARLYERALQGETGGWERLQRAMEQSGGYRKIPSAQPAASQDVTMTSSGDADTHKEEETMTSSPDHDSTVHTHHPSSPGGGGASPTMYI